MFSAKPSVPAQKPKRKAVFFDCANFVANFRILRYNNFIHLKILS